MKFHLTTNDIISFIFFKLRVVMDTAPWIKAVLARGVMVAQQILNLLVFVRVEAGQ